MALQKLNYCNAIPKIRFQNIKKKSAQKYIFEHFLNFSESSMSIRNMLDYKLLVAEITIMVVVWIYYDLLNYNLGVNHDDFESVATGAYAWE